MEFVGINILQFIKYGLPNISVDDRTNGFHGNKGIINVSNLQVMNEFTIL